MTGALSAYLFRPMYSPAELMGFMAISGAFDLSEWFIAVPLIVVWFMVCAAFASLLSAA